MNTIRQFDIASLIGNLVGGMWQFPQLISSGRKWQISVGLLRNNEPIPIADISSAIAPNIAAYHQVVHGMHKMQTSARFAHTAKNVGRANYASPLVVALTKATALHRKQVAKGYSIDGTSAQMYLPMKIHRFDKFGDRITYPADVTAKCDGLDVMIARATANITIAGVSKDAGVDISIRAGDIFAYSPTKKFYYGRRCADICRELAAFFAAFPNAVLNGEFYCHGHTLEDINSDIRDTQNQRFFQLYVFDAYFPDNAEATYSARMAILRKYITPTAFIQFVPNRLVSSKDDATAAAREFVRSGYEGGVISNLAGVYRAHIDKVVRSFDKQKIVAFDSGEFRIKGFLSDGRGKHAGIIKWVLETIGGDEFRANYADCTEAFQKDMLAKVQLAPARYIGKMMTVRYRGLTKYGIPKFAKAIAIRDE